MSDTVNHVCDLQHPAYFGDNPAWWEHRAHRYHRQVAVTSLPTLQRDQTLGALIRIAQMGDFIFLIYQPTGLKFGVSSK